MDVSVVIPVYDEVDSLPALHRALSEALAGRTYELVFVDDGSGDASLQELERLAQADPAHTRVVALRRNFGQTAAIAAGIDHSIGEVVVLIDADLQNDPADIPRLLAAAEAEDAADPAPLLIVGHRTTRRDTRVKRAASRIANAVRARLLGDATPDSGCGLKVFRRADFLDLPRFDHMHRYLPALFLRAGGRVLSVKVNHRPRLSGRSNYGVLDRLGVALFDLVGVIWLQRRGRRPEVELAPPPGDTGPDTA